MNVLLDVFNDTISQLSVWLSSSGPKLLAAVVVLVVGWLSAKVIKVASVKFMKVIKLDLVAERAGIDQFLARGNIQSNTTEVIAVIIYWFFLLLTLLIAMNTMGIDEAKIVFETVFEIIPKVVLAVVILILGLSFASFISEVVQTAAVNAQVRQARLLANLSRYAIIIFVTLVALNQLEIDTDIIRHAFLILFGSICLALSLAFGLGCRDLAGKIAEQIWEKEKEAQRALADAQDAAASTE